MNRTKYYLLKIVLFALGTVAFQPLVVADSSGQQVVYVQVKVAKLRNEAKQWGRGLKDLNYGEKVEVISQEGDWVKCKAQDVDGFVHASALSSRRILINASTSDLLTIAADEPDVFLAGKGFNEQILSAYKASSPNLNIVAVDKIRAMPKMGDSGLRTFLAEGRLNAL